MTPHSDDHEPTRDLFECETCAWAVRKVFNDMGLGNLVSGPNGVEMLMQRINDMADEYLARGPAA